MKFLVDAQLPRSLALLLTKLGHDAIHTLDLQERNKTTDAQILNIVMNDDRIVITKDVDFVDSFHLKGTPKKLLLISTGNISNASLRMLIIPNLSAIESAFDTNSFIEVSSHSLIIHS